MKIILKIALIYYTFYLFSSGLYKLQYVHYMLTVNQLNFGQVKKKREIYGILRTFPCPFSFMFQHD